MRINDEPRDDGEEFFNERQNGLNAILAQDKQESFGSLGQIGSQKTPEEDDQEPWLSTRCPMKLTPKALCTSLR